MSCSPTHITPTGIEEDFIAWKDGFMRDIFPALCGERPLSSVCSSVECCQNPSTTGDPLQPQESCECGGKSKQDCSKHNGPPSTTSDLTQPQDGDVSLGFSSPTADQ